ncbi:cAMP-dependent protein kinase inhibitor beta isoform X1 [Papio anubis]|uniref:cAMP-dependent protein kinase inhibitor beta isoform X1 n=1 Tax=Papio anubis TaxID=9555 RepID=UPI0012AE1CD9|nr:cAMP-dependent protein kinase inhibitor beta isoform X1 [Papio anubis]
MWSHAILKRHSIKRTLGEAGNPVPGTGKIGERKCIRIFKPVSEITTYFNQRFAEASEITCQTQAEPDSMSHQDVAMRTDSSKMTDVESGVANFASSARAGRRNALPDIQSSAATDGTSDLPLKLEALSVKEDAKEKDEETTQDQLEKPQNEEK